MWQKNSGNFNCLLPDQHQALTETNDDLLKWDFKEKSSVQNFQ